MSNKPDCCDINRVDVESMAHIDLLPRPPPEANTIHCRIGLDKKSGRVKWCPDCQFIKYFLVLPIILMPVIVVFVLMMRISSTFTGRIEIVPQTERIKVLDELEPYHRITRDTKHVNEILATINHHCEIIRHFAAEKSIDMYDKELFRDIRTSFIPSEWCRYRNITNDEIESLMHSINSVDDPPQTNQSKSVDQLRRWINKYADPVDFNRLNNEYDSLNFRQRRRRQIVDDSIENQNRTNQDSDAKTVIENISETEQETIEDKPLEIPAFLRTFWKGGKTYDQIRNSQVEIIKQYMDETVKPCDDFYQYACGNWDKLNPIPKDKAAYDTFEMLREILDIELNSLLSGVKDTVDSDDRSDNDANSTEMPPIEVVDSSNSIEKNIIKRSRIVEKSEESTTVNAEQKAKYLYQSCMNSAILEKRKLEPLYTLLETLGGWPVLDGDKWNASKFNW